MMAKIKKIPKLMIWIKNPAMRIAFAVPYRAGLFELKS